MSAPEVCRRCGKPIGWKVDGIDCDGGEEYVTDGYFQDQGIALPRLWFHHQCEDQKPLKLHLLPWVSILAQRRKQAA